MTAWRPVVRPERACSAGCVNGKTQVRVIHEPQGSNRRHYTYRDSPICPTCHGTGVERGEAVTCSGCRLATYRVAGETMTCGLWGAEVAVSFACAAWEAREPSTASAGQGAG